METKVIYTSRLYLKSHRKVKDANKKLHEYHHSNS